MNLLKRLVGLFSGGGPRADGRYLTIYLLSRRCNEPVSGQVDLLNELSASDDPQYTYYTRKVIHTSGDRRCFAQVEVNLYFNQNKKVVHHEVEGGRWLTAEEYTQELERFNAPPDEPEADESETTESETAEPEATEPEATEPEVTEAGTDAAATSAKTATAPTTPDTSTLDDSTPDKSTKDSDHA